MEPIRVGLVADPASPTVIAPRISDGGSPGAEDRGVWDIEVVSEPFTIGSEHVDTAVARLGNHARRHGWDLVVGLTELPLRGDDGRYLLVETDPQGRVAVLSLPALGGLRMHTRTRHAVNTLVGGMAESPAQDQRVTPPRMTGRRRLLLGMVLANRPCLLVPGLRSALVAALATGAVATINSTVWLLTGSLSWWRLTVATVASIALVVAWQVIDGELWDRPEDDSAQARERSRLHNTSTLLTRVGGHRRRRTRQRAGVRRRDPGRRLLQTRGRTPQSARPRPGLDEDPYARADAGLPTNPHRERKSDEADEYDHGAAAAGAGVRRLA